MYLERCIESIRAQTYTDFEVILVDDGSTDGSDSICDRYKDADQRFRVYHIDNQGVAHARNYGLSQIKGEWFAFMDSDDWIEPDYLEILYESAVSSGCDIAACKLSREDGYCLGYQREKVTKIMIESPEECVHNFICNTNSMQGMVWNKLYRTEIFRNVKFDEKIKINEDCLYTYEIMKICNKACFVAVPLYHWFYRTEGACHSKKKVCDFAAANVFLDLYEQTLRLADSEVSLTLQSNYINVVLEMLLYSDYSRTDEKVQEAKQQCKIWRRQVWHMFSVKTKLKYMFVFYVLLLIKWK